MQAVNKVKILQENISSLLVDLYHVFEKFHEDKAAATEDVANYGRYYRLKKAQIYYRWKRANNNKELSSNDLGCFFTIYEMLDHLFNFDKFEHRYTKLRKRAHDLIALSDAEAGDLNLWLNKTAYAFEESCAEFEFFLSKHSSSISGSFYNKLEQIMNSFGEEINEDLCTVLRTIILNKIYIYRSTGQLISKPDVAFQVEFNELLDPYEALDLFISRPRPTTMVAFIEDIITDWGSKYGNDISQQILDLQEISRIDFYEVGDPMMKYAANVTRGADFISNKQVSKYDNVRLSLDYFVTVARSSSDRLRMSLAESSQETTFQKLFFCVTATIFSALKSSADCFEQKFCVREQLEPEILWSLFNPLAYLDLVISLTEVDLKKSADYTKAICQKVGSSIKRDMQIFIYSIANIYYLAPRLILEQYKVKYNLNIDSLAAADIYQKLKQVRNHRVSYSLLFNNQDKHKFVKIFEESSSKIDNLNDSAKFHLAAIQALIKDIRERESTEIDQILNELLDGSFMTRWALTIGVNNTIEADPTTGLGWYTTKFFSFAEWFQYKILSQEGSDLICNRYEGNYFTGAQEKIKKANIIGSEELLYHMDRLENVLIEYLHFNAYVEYGQDYDNSDLAINESLEQLLVPKDLSMVENLST